MIFDARAMFGSLINCWIVASKSFVNQQIDLQGSFRGTVAKGMVAGFNYTNKGKMIQKYRIDRKVNITPLLIIFAAVLASFYSRGASAYLSEAPFFETTTDPCSEAGLISLKGDVYHIARERRPEDAWRLVQTLLCGKGEEATQLILDHIQGPDIPELQVIWPPESEGTAIYDVTIFRSKKNSLRDIENLLAKGEAVEAYVYRTNLSQYDPHAVDYRNDNYIYTDAINLHSRHGPNLSFGRTYHLFF